MNEHKNISKSVIAVSLSLALVLILVVTLFISGQRDRSQNKIQLPDTNSVSQDNSPDNSAWENSVLGVDNQNVIKALASLDRADYYHQIYSVEVGVGTNTAETTVELWVCDTLKRAQITTAHSTKTLLTDDTRLWVWYSHDLAPAQFVLTEDLTFEDILGLPAFDYLNALQTVSITEAEYLMLEEGTSETACIFLATEPEESASARYWISLENGLLYEADAMENSAQVYHVEQTAFDLLAAEDEVFLDRFLLPDGTSITG